MSRKRKGGKGNRRGGIGWIGRIYMRIYTANEQAKRKEEDLEKVLLKVLVNAHRQEEKMSKFSKVGLGENSQE